MTTFLNPASIGSGGEIEEILSKVGAAAIVNTSLYNPMYAAMAPYFVFQLSTGEVLLSSSNIEPYAGLWLFDGDSLTQVWSGGASWTSFSEVDEGCLISGGSYAGGILKYDSASRTVRKIWDNGNSWRVFTWINDRLTITGSTSGVGASSGILVYNNATGTIRQVFDASPNNNGYVSVPVNGGVCFGMNGGSSDKGVVLYEYSTDTARVVGSTTGNMSMLTPIDGDCLLTSNTNAGVMLFNSSTKTAYSIWSEGTNWTLITLMDFALGKAAVIRSGATTSSSATNANQELKARCRAAANLPKTKERKPRAERTLEAK